MARTALTSINADTMSLNTTRYLTVPQQRLLLPGQITLHFSEDGATSSVTGTHAVQQNNQWHLRWRPSSRNGRSDPPKLSQIPACNTTSIASVTSRLHVAGPTDGLITLSEIVVSVQPQDYARRRRLMPTVWADSGNWS